jgi:hypothetical protein
VSDFLSITVAPYSRLSPISRFTDGTGRVPRRLLADSNQGNFESSTDMALQSRIRCKAVKVSRLRTLCLESTPCNPAFAAVAVKAAQTDTNAIVLDEINVSSTQPHHL